MPQISIVKLKDIKEAQRFDAEYFKPEYLAAEKLIKSLNWKYLDFFSEKITDGSHQTPQYREQGIPFLMVRDIKDFQLNFDNVKYIDRDFDNKLKHCKPQKGDIIFSKVGTLGRLVYIDTDIDFNIFVSLAIIKQVKNINPYYLSVFLLSKYGLLQQQRFNKGIAQLDLHLEDIRKIKVFVPPDSFQKDIENDIKLVKQKQNRAKQLYKEAEELLLRELGLLDYKPKHQLTFTATKKEIDEAGRFDAEYFQSKYKEIIERIENYKGGWDYVGSIVNWKKGVEVGSEMYQEEGVPFVRVSDFSKYGIENVEKRISENLYNELKKYFQPKKGEILFTKDGTIGIAYNLKEDFEGILSGAFLRLTLKEKYKDFKKECLALIFNSIISKMQVEKLSGGALIAHLKPSDFERFKIPLIPPQIQSKITKLIQKSHQLRRESKELLEKAKRKVEEEIEKVG